MSKADQAKAWALSRVGCPYVYGGTGKACTVSYREARAAQYPQYADKIRKNCPRLHENAASCKGCKWAEEDGTGKRCYDCAQLVRWCMDAIGITMVSGANSQWTQTDWAQKGTVDNLPVDKLCIVYREDSDGKKHHTGIYLGDGTIVHAKGHDYGVMHEKLGDPRFTHWGIPWGLYEEMKPMAPKYPSLSKGASGAYVYIMQAAICLAGKTVTIDGKFGAKTEAALKEYQAAMGQNITGVCGSQTWSSLLGLENPAPSLEGYLVLGLEDGKELRGTLSRSVELINKANWE